MTEQELLDGLSAGSTEALQDCIRQYSGLVYTVIQRRMGSVFTPEDGEELTSDVFAALWSQHEKVHPGMLKSWLAAVAANMACSACRRIRQVLPLEAAANAADSPFWEALENKELNAELHCLLQELTEEERTLLTGYYFYEKSVKQLAEERHISPEACKVRLHRLRKKLKHQLEERGY